MHDVDRLVRVAVLELLAGGAPAPGAADVAVRLEIDPAAAADALRRLADARQLVLSPGRDRVVMAHPFSGIPTDHHVEVGNLRLWANCGWDGFAILALLGDGRLSVTTADSSTEAVWEVSNGEVASDGLVHFVVPPRSFWDDIGFT